MKKKVLKKFTNLGSLFTEDVHYFVDKGNNKKGKEGFSKILLLSPLNKKLRKRL